MILRNAVVRHGRRSVPCSISRSCLRQLSTDTTTPEIITPSSTQVSSWPASDGSARELPKIVSSARKKEKVVQENIMALGLNSSHAHKGRAWTKPHTIGEAGIELSPAEQWAEFQRMRSHTKSLGSFIERRYEPTELFSKPPAPEDVSLELLMASQTHMGHHTSLWNPANSRYIYGVREGIHIIALESTAAHLRRAARVVEEVAYRAGLILIVGTRKGQMEIVTKSAELAGACHLFTKWTPGSITNRDVILNRQTTKVIDHLDNELPDFERYSAGSRPLMPDLVVCLNPKENYTLLYECGLKSIPTIGVIDTDADPTWVTYTIPANDDSLRSTGLIAGVLGRAGSMGQQRRRAESEDGKVPWTTATDLKKHVVAEKQAALGRRKEVLGQMQNVEGFTKDEEKLLQQMHAQNELPDDSEDAMMGILRDVAGSEEAAPTASAAASSKLMGDIESLMEVVETNTAEVKAQLQRMQ